MKKNTFLTMLFVLFSIYTYSQKEITGKVNFTNEKGLPDVNIRLKGAINANATTNQQGEFSIQIPENSSQILIFKKDGFDQQEINVKNLNTVNITLIEQKRLNQYGQLVTRTEADAEFRNGIITFESKDKKFAYWFDSRIYIDGAYFFDKNAYNQIGNGIIVRRARFAAKANLWENWYGEIDLDFAGAQMELKDVYLKYTTKNQKTFLKVGNFKEGFSMESTTTSRYITFIERSLVNEFTPSRHLGFNATTWGNNYNVIAGVHFQQVGELEQVTYTQNLNKDFGVDEGYSLTTRIVGRPISNDNITLHIAGNATYRTPETSWEFNDQYRISTRSISTVNRKKYLDTDNIVGVENIFLYGAEFATFYKNIMFQTEYMVHNINRIEGLQPVKNDGFYAQAGYIVFGGAYQYNKAEAEPTQIKRGKEWGDIELAARYDYLNLNDENAQIFGGSAEAYTFGLNYHVNSNVKFMLNYTYINHDRYASGKGKLFVGHDIDGNLTTDYKKVVEETGKAGDDFGMLQVRFEIDF